MYIDFVLSGVKESAYENECLEQLNSLLELLGAKAEIKTRIGDENVSTYRYLSICADDEEIEKKRTRGAGRKKNNKEYIDKWMQFCELHNQGKSKTEIQEQMKISDATYFRYLKSKREGNL